MESNIRTLQKSDYERFIGKADKTMKGLAFEIDGELVGIAAILHQYPLYALSKITDKARQYPKFLVKSGREFTKLLATYETEIYADASETESNAPKFLELMGFKQYDKNIYVWVNYGHVWCNRGRNRRDR